MNNLDHISEGLETIFWVKILKFFDADPGWKKFESGIRDGKNSGPESGINIPDLQHWIRHNTIWIVWYKPSSIGIFSLLRCEADHSC
jgi:hypothetical protein